MERLRPPSLDIDDISPINESPGVLSPNDDPPVEPLVDDDDECVSPPHIMLVSPRDDDDLLDPSLKHDPTKGTSVIGTVFLIVNAALGAGLLNFPIAFHQAGGIAVACAVQAVMLIFVMIALFALAHTANINHADTLQVVMHTAAGKWGGRITSAIIALYCFGTCITFLIIIGDQSDRAFASLISPDFCHSWYLNRDFFIPVTSIVIILPFCFAQKIDFLRWTSIGGVVTVIYVVGVIIYEYFSGNYTPGPVKTAPESWYDVFSVIPVICFGYQCHVSVVPIYSCMKKRDLKHFGISSSIAIALCVFAYTGAAAFGYLTFGAHVAEDIISNYDAKNLAVLIAVFAIALKTYTTYPILLFCGREGILTMIEDAKPDWFPREIRERREKHFRYGIAVIWFALTVLMAIEIPNIGEVMDILGSLAAVFIFVFPGICILQTTLAQDTNMVKTMSKVKVLSSILFIALGMFLFGVVFTQGISDFIKPSSGSGKGLICVP